MKKVPHYHDLPIPPKRRQTANPSNARMGISIFAGAIAAGIAVGIASALFL